MAAKPNKTQVTAVSVADFLAGVEPEGRRKDAEVIVRDDGAAFRRTGPYVGAEHRRFRRAPLSLRQRAGGRDPEGRLFPPQTGHVALCGGRLGGTRLDGAAAASSAIGKSCLYVKRLADIDLSVLETLISRALEKSDG